MSRLGDIAARPAPGTRTKLADKLFGGRGELATMPLLGDVYIRLAGERETLEIDSQVFAIMKAADLAIDVLTQSAAEAVRAALTLAVAVRDPDNHEIAFGSVEEWRGLDLDVLNAAWQVYGDVRLRLDPVESGATEADFAAIEVAIAKKNSTLLRSFGVVTLASYLLSTADRPPTSPDPRSGSGAESPAGSG